jgi:aminoglycoside phosphotransferase (APT) family kinase protein
MNMNDEWLRQLLADLFPDTVSAAITVQHVGEGYGLASSLFRCSWERVGTDTSVVVKLWDVTGVAGTREVEFYRTLAPSVEGQVPHCLHAAIDAERARAVLVLEDLDGMVQGDCLQPLSPERAVTLASTLAVVHSAWWEHSDLLAAAWLPSVTRLELAHEWFETRRALVLHRFGDRLQDRAHVLLQQIEQVQARANERLAGAAVTLVHGDFHLDNVMFRAGTGAPVLLDWARVARGPGVLDVIELIVSLEDTAEQDRVLDAYLARLNAGGVPGPDKELLREQLGGALLRKFISATCGVANWQPATPREAAMIEVGLDRVQRAIEGWEGHDAGLFSL